MHDPEIANWEWVDTRRLVSKVWDGLGRRLRHAGFSKWGMLLREFLLTLEQELEPIMSGEMLKKTAAIYPDLVKADRLRRQFVEELKRKITELSESIITRRDGLWVRENAWPQEHAIALHMYPLEGDPQKATFMLFDGQQNDDPPYAVQFYSRNSIDCSFESLKEETVSGVNLYVYRHDYHDMEKAFGGFKEALQHIIPTEA